MLNTLIYSSKWGMLVVVAIVAYAAGTWRATHTARLKYEQQITEQQLIAAQRYAAQLKAAQIQYQQDLERAIAINHNTLKIDQQISNRLQKNKDAIPYVINQDQTNAHPCMDGIGTHSLQLYRQSLGY